MDTCCVVAVVAMPSVLVLAATVDGSPDYVVSDDRARALLI